MNDTRAFLVLMREKYGQLQIATSQPEQKPEVQIVPTQRQIIVSPRICTVYETEWCAIYEVLLNGRFRRIKCMAQIPSNPEWKRAISKFLFDMEDRGLVDEVCPACDAHPLYKTDGTRIESVWCPVCERCVCLGRSEAKQQGIFFRCCCRYTGFVGPSRNGIEGALGSGSGSQLGS
jgi:hypothetical protein